MPIVGLKGIVPPLSPPNHCVTVSAGIGANIMLSSKKAKLIHFSNNQPVSQHSFQKFVTLDGPPQKLQTNGSDFKKVNDPHEEP